ncbi:MAG: hypothetical protein P8Y37_13825 [Anaerolineales bacterium]
MMEIVRYLKGKKLEIDWKIGILTIASTLLITADYYFNFSSANNLDSILLYIVIPAAITVFVFRESPTSYGLTIGDWKAGLLITAFAILLMAPILWYLGTKQGAMQQYYRIQPGGLIWKKGLKHFRLFSVDSRSVG